MSELKVASLILAAPLVTIAGVHLGTALFFRKDSRAICIALGMTHSAHHSLVQEMIDAGEITSAAGPPTLVDTSYRAIGTHGPPEVDFVELPCTPATSLCCVNGLVTNY